MHVFNFIACKHLQYGVIILSLSLTHARTHAHACKHEPIHYNVGTHTTLLLLINYVMKIDAVRLMILNRLVP